VDVDPEPPEEPVPPDEPPPVESLPPELPTPVPPDEPPELVVVVLVEGGVTPPEPLPPP
jgi:hypothetical protein